MKLLSALGVSASLVVLGFAGAGPARAAALSGSIAMYSDPGDYIGQGVQQVWPNAAAGVSGNPGDLTVSLSDASGNSWDLEFAAPPGQSLQPGVYDHAERAPFRGSSPGIDINGAGRGCNIDAGRFEVKDIAFDSSGTPTRLWIIFEQHCEGGPRALFGEVRLGEPPDGSRLQSAASLVRWPAEDFGTPETVVPVQFVASQAASVSGTSITGANPSDFRINSDSCTGATLSLGRVCTVYVAFVPSASGLRTATLDLNESGGGGEQVPLQGWTYGGTTRLVMNSDSGDFIGQGQSYSYSPAGATLEASGTPEKFTFAVQGSGGDWWQGEFEPSQGQIFTTGSVWTNAARAGFQGTAPGMDVDGDGRGCNTVSGQFQVISATYTPEGAMQTFAVKFEQHCEGAGPALRGEFDWRLDDTAPPAPWMASSNGGSGSGASTGSSSPASTTSVSTQATGPSSRILVSSLSALLARQSSRERRAFAPLARASGTRTQRRRALGAINRLLSLLAAARTDLSHLAVGPSARATKSRLLRALTSWRAALVKERSMVRSGRPRSASLAAALSRRELADASAALRILRRLRTVM